MLELTPETRSWLSERYPRLLVSELQDRIVVRGILDINRTYGTIPIQDAYAISLVLLKNGDPPTVRETGGRLQKVFEARQGRLKSIIDLHVYPSGKLCIMAPQEWTVNIDLQQNISKLFDEYLEPYFYSQSFFERNGEWPWAHLPHGLPGIIAWFTENHTVPGAVAATVAVIKKLAEEPKSSASKMIARAKRRNSFMPRERCLCGRNKSYLMCHPCLPKLTVALRADRP